MRDKPDSKSEASGLIYMFGGFALYTILMVYLMIQKSKDIPIIDNLSKLNSWIFYSVAFILVLLSILKKKLDKDKKYDESSLIFIVFSNLNIFFVGVLFSMMFFTLIL